MIQTPCSQHTHTCTAEMSKGGVWVERALGCWGSSSTVCVGVGVFVSLSALSLSLNISAANVRCDAISGQNAREPSFFFSTTHFHTLILTHTHTHPSHTHTHTFTRTYSQPLQIRE